MQHSLSLVSDYTTENVDGQNLMHSSSAGAPLFSFGTLMDEDVLACVAGQPLSDFSIDAAIVQGHAQRDVVGQDFPVLVPNCSASTSGVLISGLTDLALRRILFFEGEEYELESLSVERANGTKTTARYFRDTAVYEIGTTAWDFEVWRRNKKQIFLVRTERFMELFGTMSAREADAYW